MASKDICHDGPLPKRRRLVHPDGFSKPPATPVPVPKFQSAFAPVADHPSPTLRRPARPHPAPAFLPLVSSSDNKPKTTLRLIPPPPLPPSKQLAPRPPPLRPKLADNQSLRPISATRVALASELSTEAELSSIFLHGQPGMAVGDRQLDPLTPRQTFLCHGLAARASRTLSNFHTSLLLWKKENESHSIRAPPPEMRMRIVKIVHSPPAQTALPSRGIALCEVHSVPAQEERRQVVFLFASGPNSELDRFLEGRTVHIWGPWQETSLTAMPVPATGGTINESPCSDTMLLCSRFAIL